MNFKKKADTSFKELSNGTQHGHIWGEKNQPCSAQGSKSVIFVFPQYLKLYAPLLWPHVFFFHLRQKYDKNPMTKIEYSPVMAF